MIYRILAMLTFGAMFTLLDIPTSISQQMPSMRSDSVATTSMAEGEIAHPFFTHMGMPEAVGTYNVRLGAVVTQMDGISRGDFAFHFETGLSNVIGLHIRNDMFLENSHTEFMFQFAAIKSSDGMSGFSPLIEFEVPTHSGASNINTLVGFSTALVGSRFAFNQVLHYSPREDMVEGSASLVFKAEQRVFLVVEALGEKMPGEQTIVNGLLGAKVKLTELITLGIGYQVPLTSNRNFSSQYVLQPDLEWKR